MDISKESLSHFCERIVTGKYLFRLDDSKILEVYDATAALRQEANFLSTSYAEYLSLEGIPCLELVKITACENCVWQDSFDDFLARYPEKKKSLLQEIKRLEFRSIEKLKPKKELEILERNYKQIKAIDNLLYQNSSEYLINLYQHKYYVYKGTTLKNEPYFNMSFAEFLDAPHGALVNRIIYECYHPKDITEKILRLVARNEPWRSMWLAAVKTGNLFNRSASDLTDLQRALISWTCVYDNAFESMNPPSNEIIEDDALFDDWMLEQQQESERSRATKKINAKSSSMNGDKNEVGIIVDTPEDAQKVWSLNNKYAQSQIAQNQQAIQKKGIVKEIYLPDSQKAMRIKLANS